MHFMTVRKSRKRSACVIYAFTAGMQVLKLWYERGTIIVNRRYIRKGYFFCQKWKRKGWGGLGIGEELPRLKLCWVPPLRSCFFFVHKLTLKPLSTVKDHTASLTGKAVREKTLLTFLQKLAIIGWGREWSEELLRSRRMLFAQVYYLYTCRWDDTKKKTSQIALKLTRKKTNERHQVKIFILYCQLLPDLAHLSDLSFISITVSSFLPINI